MALDKQINLFKVDTNAFLFEDEKYYKKRLDEYQLAKADLQRIYKKKNKKKTSDSEKYDLKLLEEKINKFNREELNVEKRIYKNSRYIWQKRM